MASPESPVPKQWLSVHELAEFLGIKVSTVYSYVSSRRIPHHKVPGSQLVRFKVSEIDEWMDTGRVPTTAEYLRSQLQKGK